MISAHSTEDVSSFLLQQNSELESFYHTETSYWFNKIAGFLDIILYSDRP
jgi:hypothetical protein